MRHLGHSFEKFEEDFLGKSMDKTYLKCQNCGVLVFEDCGRLVVSTENKLLGILCFTTLNLSCDDLIIMEIIK